MASDAATNRAIKQKRFFRARMTFRQSDSALRVHVIFVDPTVEIDET